MSAIRVCWPSFPDLYRMDDEGRLVGPLASAIKARMEGLRGLNHTLSYSSSIGRASDGQRQEYDGCLGSMQRNETDVLLTPVWYEVPVPGPGLKQGIADGYERVGILSAYNRTLLDSATRTHVLDMVFAFSPGLWILTCVSFLVLSICLVNSLRVHGKRRLWRNGLTIYSLVASLVRQHSSVSHLMPSAGSIRSFYLLITLFAFLIIFYLTSMIKTEMVVVGPPVTVESYDDISKSGRRPVWAAVLTDVNQFAGAKHGSKERKIWNMAVRMGIDDSLMQSNLESVILHGMRIAKLEEVGLVKQLLGYKRMSREACAFSRSRDFMTNVNTLLYRVMRDT